MDASTLGLAGASHDARWSFSASARHDPWEAGTPTAARFAPRDALDGGATRATLAFDFQRAFGASRFQAGAFASRRHLGVHSVESLEAEHLEQRDQRGATGAHVQLGHGPFRAALRFREETLDADARLFGAHARALGTLREDRLRQSSTGLDLHQHLSLARAVEGTIGVRIDEYRYAVGSDLPGRSGAGAGLLVAPSLALRAALSPRTRAFARAGRGDDEVAAAAAVDPRVHAPLGVLDPAADALHATLGLEHAGGGGLETRVALSRTRAAREVRLAGALAAERIDRPAERDALHLGARWHALPGLILDAEGTWLTATYRDGAREAIPGAAVRHATAGATLRPSRGWSASLFVSYFATRDTADDEGERLRASTLVNARLTHNLSRKTRVSLDVFNVFAQSIGAIDYHAASRLWGRPGMADDFLFHPAEPRGFRVRLRTTF